MRCDVILVIDIDSIGSNDILLNAVKQELQFNLIQIEILMNCI